MWCAGSRVGGKVVGSWIWWLLIGLMLLEVVQQLFLNE